MSIDELKRLELPDRPGVYKFIGQNGVVLYVGKATSLKDRTKSYFSNDVLRTRGKHILDMVSLASSIEHEVTDSALEALILEASLIKQLQPYYNTKEKDDKSFNYVVFSDEDYPSIKLQRERTMLVGNINGLNSYKYVFGPFPSGSSISEGIKIIRKIFPFRSNCTPGSGVPCFDRQIGLCPGVCSNEISKKDYAKTVVHIKLFFEGKKKLILSKLKKQMQDSAKRQEFEDANRYKKMIFALEHIKDVSLLDSDIKKRAQSVSGKRRTPFRIEAYDIAHISGTNTVGVMVVFENGVAKRSEYRKFKIKGSEGNNDIKNLGEIFERRITHQDWRFPDLIVVDGGEIQKRTIQQIVKKSSLSIPVVSVVKDQRHKAKGILGDRKISELHKTAIVAANAESHRFAVAYHRNLRDRLR